MPTLRATPPVKVSSCSTPTRRSRPMEREPIDWCTPSKMSWIAFPLPSHDSTSDSANTVQVGLHGPPAVTADLGHLSIPEGHPITSVAGPDDVLDLLFLQAAVSERFHIGVLGGGHHVGAGVDQGARHDAAMLVP